MPELDDFILASDRVVEFQAYFGALTKEDHSIHSLEIQKDEMILLWKTLRSSYDTLLSKIASSKEKADLKEIKNKFYIAYNAHIQSLSKAQELLDSLKIPISPTPEQANIPHSISRINLPPCDMSNFHGDYESWPTFRDQFSALYGEQDHIPSVEKLCHLLKKTKGEAHEIVRSCPFTNAGFQMAWQNLVERYENKRVLINAQLKTLFGITPITKESGPSIKTLQRTINNCVTSLDLLQIDTVNWDVIFVYICSTCLPDVTLNLWEQFLRNSVDLPTWKEMDAFLTSRFHALESVSDIRSSHFSQNSSKKNPQDKVDNAQNSRKVNSYSTNINSNKAKKCTLCQETHPLRLCPTFLRMSIEERFATVKNQKRCTNCLGTSHEYKKCKSQYVCSICKQKHHSLLHRTQSTPSVLMSTQNIPNGNSNIQNNFPVNTLEQPTTSAEAARIQQSYSTQLQSTISTSTLLGTASVNIHVGNLTYTVRALIDPASEASFISRRTQKKLSLPYQHSQTEIVGLGGSVTATSSQICLISIGSLVEPSFNMDVPVFVVDKLTGHLPSCCYSSVTHFDFPNLTMADTNPSRSNVDLLLGGDIYPRIIRNGLRWNQTLTLVAQQSIFGWIVTGKPEATTSNTTVNSFFNKVDLDHLLNRFWELEELPRVKHLSEDDRYCEEYYQNTTYRNQEGRFVVSLPFIRAFPEEKCLGLSRNMALSQFLRSETRLCKDLVSKTQYSNVISEYLTLNHMKRITPEVTPNSNSYYLPHHAVLKPDSTTTKLRVVFNASSPTSNGTSLNDVLYPGPVLQADLPTLIHRWRFFKYVFNADIEKMYRQILINPNQTPFQRIIYRNSPQDDLSDFELTTVTFGVNCAPYLAIRTLLELARQCEDEYPVASNIIRNYMYVDDVLFGSHDINDVIKSRNQIIDVLRSAGFSLRKWTANSTPILKDLPLEHLLDKEFLNLSDSCSSKLLGLRWNAGNDFFHFKLKEHPNRNQFTKRNVLSDIAKLFDPAGWLSPKLIVAKMIMQQIWKDNIGWDEAITPSTWDLWTEFLDDYPNIEKIKIPRFVNYYPTFSIEIHGFCDASEKAYAATLYLRTQSSEGQIYTHLLTSKTKVAPIKYITLPRKELCGAELLAKMFSHFKTQFLLSEYQTHMWTDSTIVLAWLQKPSYHWATFVANRTESILEKVSVDCWSHVDSKDNPADIASRGCSASELIHNDLWWYGPSWLRLSHTHWPQKRTAFETAEEIKTIRTHVSRVSSFDLLNRFSDLARAMRVLCYVYRFFHLTHSTHKHNYRYNAPLLRQEELKYVKSRLIILSQQFHFPEYDLLLKGEVLPRKSILLRFNPFIDADGFLRVNGRLSNSTCLTYNEKFPKILPYSGRFTRLYLELIHKYSVHGENSLLMRVMRSEFWVPKLRNLVKSVIHSCKVCVLHKHKQSRQLMASLPPERSSLSRPFTNTGVDFAGPFDIKSYAGRGLRISKGYVLVFVCFSTKAIHLELTSDISTNAFLAAFARFFSRRGCPSALYSDNGKSFVGAANILNRDQVNFLSDVRKGLLSENTFQNLAWHFNPPGAPHMGGLWEAGVKSFKSHLKKITHSQKFTYEEFYTMLTRIEACLNSRPLCPINDDPSELNPLTPGHFLVGSPLLVPPEPDFSNRSIGFVNRWQKLKILHHMFAIRWKEEYLKELHKRNKWQYPQRDFSPNDLVVIRCDNLPPTQWQLGRIEKVMPGSDSRVRVAQVRTSRGLIVRPIVKLVLLPPCESN